MRRFNRVLAVGSIAAVALTGCGGGDEPQAQEQTYSEYTPTCIDPNTQEVLPLDYCEGEDSDSGDFLMTYVLMSAMMNNGSTTHVYPQVGQTLPKDTYVTKKPSKGTQVTQKTFADRVKTYSAKKSTSAPVQKKQVTKADQAPKKSEVKAPPAKKKSWGSSSSKKSSGFKSSTRRR